MTKPWEGKTPVAEVPPTETKVEETKVEEKKVEEKKPEPPPAPEVKSTKKVAVKKPSIGRVVLYKLSQDDVLEISKNRKFAACGQGPEPHKHCHGNDPEEGREYPAIVVAVWGPECVNLQVLLDGNDSLWVTSANEGTGSRNWCWPPMV